MSHLGVVSHNLLQRLQTKHRMQVNSWLVRKKDFSWALQIEWVAIQAAQSHLS